MGKNRLNKTVHILINKNRNRLRNANDNLIAEPRYHYATLFDISQRSQRRFAPIIANQQKTISSSYIKRNQALHNMSFYNIVRCLASRTSVFEVKNHFNSATGLSDLY